MDRALAFRGRILFLSSRLDAIRRQLRGEDLALGDCAPLRDDVSTDEITPTTVCLYYDERLRATRTSRSRSRAKCRSASTRCATAALP